MTQLPAVSRQLGNIRHIWIAARGSRLGQGRTGLHFLVFDELHTYRGRQGADVALLIRRCRSAFGGHDFICIGTSATMSSEGTSQDQKREVARVAETLFGAAVNESQVIGETLERATPELPRITSAVAGRIDVIPILLDEGTQPDQLAPAGIQRLVGDHVRG